MFFRTDKILSSTKQVKRTREVSPFVAEVLSLGLEKGGYAYVSHKEWLEKVGKELTPASEKNGPRYSLKRHGIDCKAVSLSGDDLKLVAKQENRELTDKDTIYVMTAVK